MTSRILGAVLAGGASSRFGSDKALATIGGRTLLDHARATLAGVADEVAVVGRGEVPDLPVPGLGPLGGIAAALEHGVRGGFASVLTIGCDMPEVPAALLAELLESGPSYCADAPVLGHWPSAMAGALLTRLRDAVVSQPPGAAVASRQAALSVRRWAVSIGAVAIPSPVPLRNVNVPADLPPP